ncbi:MAG: hypothetical protein ACOX6E_01565 [Syntrophomonadaceae bacterium]
MATSYITAFFLAVCEQAIHSNEQEVHVLAEETTPGGINYMVKEILTEQGGFSMWAKAMESVIERLAANIPR